MSPSALRRPMRLIGLAAATAVLAAACSLPDLPNLDEERARDAGLPQTSMIFAADGTLITTLHAEQDRVLVPPDRIPQSVKDAVVAIEDQRFWTHRGVDVKALLRAASRNAEEGEIVEGGSTITQQYVKNVIVGSEKTLDRKLKEAILAYQLEQDLSKEEILGNYLNTVYFGQGAYGIKAAARQFFSKPVPELNLDEAALLAGLIASPATYDPVTQPEQARARRDIVLERMHELGMITTGRFAKARSQELTLNLAPDTRRYAAPYFVEYVKQQILTDPRFGRTYTQRYDTLFAGGLRIHTTLDLDVQGAAEQAVAGILSQPGDPYAALTAVDPRNGHIVAMVGGRDFFVGQKVDRFAKVNLATGGITGRQAGSAFKPFALVAALERGISPSQVYAGGTSIALDDPVCGNGPGDPWVVENYEGSSYGPVTVEQATIDSVNVVYAQLIRDVGPQRVLDAAKRMGIHSKLRPFCSSVLGTNEVNSLEMASAFGTLANTGTHVEPVAIDRITDAAGTVLFEAHPKQQQAVDPAVAWTATNILREVVSSGTGIAANIGRPQAGKTGTAQEWRDAWFVGFVPQLSTAVWVGFPQGQIPMVPPRTRIRVTGGSFPAQIWGAFMSVVTRGMPAREFPKPEGAFVSLSIDVTRGCIANEFTPPENVRVVEFVVGAEPKTRCPAPTLTSPTEVPGLLGLSAETALQLLEPAGFVVTQSFEYAPSYVPGTVIEQFPEPGEKATPGMTISLIVSTARPSLEAVPDVVGLREAQARKELELAGFVVSASPAAANDPTAKRGRVIAQTPAAGEKRPLGSTVSLTINPSPS